MRTRVHLLLAGALVGLGALLAAPFPAEAKLTLGDAAPDFEGKEWFNTEPTSLKRLRGRIVFIELFSTG
jgi:hypothetical protein